MLLVHSIRLNSIVDRCFTLAGGAGAGAGTGTGAGGAKSSFGASGDFSTQAALPNRAHKVKNILSKLFFISLFFTDTTDLIR